MKRVLLFLSLVMFAGAVLLVIPAPTFAQGETGSISGVVTDSQGATVAGAEVTLTDLATNTPRTQVTNDSGRYHFASLPVGFYDVTFTKTGFKVHRATGQKVSVGGQLTLDVALEVGALTESVVVSSQAGSELQTANATIGTTIDLKQLELLPNLGRDASTLMALQPGVTARGDVAGSYMDQNTYTVDGGNNTDDMAGNTIGYLQNFTGISGSQTNGMASGVVATPIESVEEFKVNTVGQTSDFNSSAGAQVMMVTRRGTNDIHGSVYGFYYATNHGGANSWENNHTPFNKGLVPIDPATGKSKVCSAGSTYSSGDNNCQLPYTPLIPNHRSRFGFSIGGPIIPKKILGGKTYMFFNYEGFRYPNSTTFERNYPTAAFRAGVIQVPFTTGGTTYQVAYNLNPTPVTVQIGNSTSTTSPLQTCTIPGYASVYGPGCGNLTAGVAVDPRGLGMSPIVRTLWANTLPIPNDNLSGDQYNTQGFLSTIRLPLTSNSYTWRMDHDFGANHHFFGSFRAFKLLNYPSGVQVDVGGIVSGSHQVGVYENSAQRPQLGELMVLGLTSTLTSKMTNDVRVSYLWNWWQWSTSSTTSQLPGVGGPQGALLEIAPAGTAANAESTAALIPFNVNTQSVRQRVWDGQDKMIRDDVTWVEGNHVFQFGGLYQHNYDFHTRTDNGSTVNNQVVYQVAVNSIGGITVPANASANASLYRNLLTSVYGMVGLTQVIYTRAGSDLHLLPLGTLAEQKSTIPSYSAYFSDTWRWKPTVTLNYGIGYTLEMPPVEKEGRQVELVFPDGSLVHTDAFLAQRQSAALAGQAYAPILGFETTGNLGIKYPYNPFYGGISPRVSVAWNPNFRKGILHKLFGDGESVIRGGYSLAYGRLNGVNQVLVPLLGPGPLQSVTCGAPLSNLTCGSASTVSNAFRIGPDGLVAPLAAPTAILPQPYLPGVTQIANGVTFNNPAAGDATVLDPDYKPERVHSFNLTLQRAVGKKMFFEIGYIGKVANNIFEEIDIDSVPYMMTRNGQTFADAWAKMYINLCGFAPACQNNAYNGAVQPFFESALTPGTGYCAGFASCTAAVASKQIADFRNTTVSNMWAQLNAATGWNLGRTMLSSQATAFNTTTSLGFSNYNSAFARMSTRDWHGFTSIANFTWGKALGTGEIGQYNSSNMWLDNWNKRANYGPAVFDYKVLVNAGVTYKPTLFRGEHGWKGRVLDGWSVSPFFFMRSGAPIRIGFTDGGNCSTNCQAFGSAGNPSTSGSAFEAALPIDPHYSYNPHLVRGSTGTNGIGTVTPFNLNMFDDPSALYNNFRRCILGYDTNCGGINNLRGMPQWNLDATLAKEIKFTERVGFTLTVQFTNVLNHFQPSDASSLTLSTPANFGRITTSVYNPRQMEIGGRIHF
ncbi:MAG TPA: carboxypeptidase-like regulatory domain-containing protein [Pyrinomonadaceae bacterium]|nr:carboxypeptidase-like regulatory domain-containing protein [Pyrinomonadaceae bacterium]